MDKYRKIKVVGKGSFGHAVLVQSLVDRKLYIMKIINVSSMDRKQKEEALNEVHVLKAMRHPYIVTYRESFMDKRCLCIVMDYADGGDMYSKIAKQKQLGKGFPENLILNWFVQICLAIKHIHDRKILHRDLKTQNVFLTSQGEVKIGDFGIARVLQHTYDCAQTAIGTPYYLSPEICREQPYNQKSDIWSLGCILYEMVTLRHAFDASSMKGLVVKILKGTYPAIPTCYSQQLKDLIDEMLQKDPHKRPSIKKIIEKDFLSWRIPELLSQTVAKHELGRTFIKQSVNDISKEELQKSGIDKKKLSEDLSKPEDRPLTALDKRHPESSSSDLDKLRIKRPTSEERKVRDQSSRSPARRVNNYLHISDEPKETFKENNPPGQPPRGDLISPKDSQEDEFFEEEESQRVRSHFLTPDGVPLPGITDEDSAFTRIEALRIYLEKQLGMEVFIQAYQYLYEPPEDDENDYLKDILGKDMKYVPLIHQLIVCEDQYFSSGNR